MGRNWRAVMRGVGRWKRSERQLERRNPLRLCWPRMRAMVEAGEAADEDR